MTPTVATTFWLLQLRAPVHHSPWPRTILLLAFGALVLYLALRSLRAQRLKERYVLLFLFVGMPFLVLALWPDGIVFVSQLLNIEKATVLIMALAAFLILMIFEFFSIISVQERKIAALAQIVGLLAERQQMHMGDRQVPPPTATPQGEGDERGNGRQGR